MSDDSDNEPLSMRELLHEWNIPEDVTRNFIDNGITPELLKTLGADLLQELCPHIATRINLKKKIDAFVFNSIDNKELDNSRNENTHSHEVYDSDDEGSGHEETENHDETENQIDYFPSLNLKELLTFAPEGKNILTDYEQNEKLNSTNQQTLIDIIGRFLFPWLEKNSMHDHHYRCLLNKIKNLFPNECLSVYFIKPVPKRLSPTNKPIAMRGKLPDKIRNLKWTSGISRGKKRKNNALAISIEEKHQKYNELLGEHVDAINWLKTRINPWSSVEAKWNSTFEIRNCSTHKTVREFIDEWPILNDLRGKSLISLHFAKMFPNKGELLRTNWRTFFDRMKTLRSAKYAKDAKIQSYKEMIATLENGEEATDLRFILELSMLPYLVPPKGRNSKKIKHGCKEASETIVLFVENPGDIDTEMENQKLRALNKKDTVQPYVIIQGNELEHNQVFLVVDSIKYQFNSAMKAVDCLFKCFHVFQAQYPKDSAHIHLLIQRCLYTITTKYDVLPSTILEIVEVFERL
ncbi:hypothetical protein KQX54_011731 [Cotesia glomerata]|uniref:Uncharacterized protein n=1 Tax=Cotesia glomerata TaxID=32391 RepID=A0AAV7HTH6_COTGL|nr:hypothetical protein KQX54_011731 [Cotesia glomerata]